MNNQRTLQLKQAPEDLTGDCVIYVMGRDQRVRDNHPLLFAQAEALEKKLPLLVIFNVLKSTGFRRREHYQFMINGLKQVEADLQKKDIPFVLTMGTMRVEIEKIAKILNPASIYFDFSPLRGPRSAQKAIADKTNCNVYVVDTHNIVPTWVISDHEEYAAHTLRRKLHRTIEEWCVEPDTLKKHPYSFHKKPDSATWADVEKLVSTIQISGIDHGFTSGEKAAKHKLQSFIETGLDQYADGRNDASKNAQSDLSPYLHFGQLSSLRIVLDILEHSSTRPHLFRSLKMPSYEGDASRQDGINAFIEELVVRKELSDNFCLHQKQYDSLGGAKDWAKATLKKHATDPRETLYNAQQLKSSQTHDELWNAAQNQLTKSGKIHGYMRMYWAKKILEWSESPEKAVEIAIKLNDTYHLDGGDPNGYVGILWSIAGLHDRPWFERDIYGTIRYMSAGGISKKFDTKKYISEWS